jgi:hypothetical protein
LDAEGYLPVGVHLCTLQELEDRFGRFQTTNRRPELFARLQTYLKEAGDAGVVKAVVIDGSFVTATETPNDVDLVVVLADEHDLGTPLRPSQYNSLSPRRIRRRFAFDALVARDNSPEYWESVLFYQQVRGQPDLRKGVLRIDL